jgi:hypothetical protein
LNRESDIFPWPKASFDDIFKTVAGFSPCFPCSCFLFALMGAFTSRFKEKRAQPSARKPNGTFPGCAHWQDVCVYYFNALHTGASACGRLAEFLSDRQRQESADEDPSPFRAVTLLEVDFYIVISL